MGYPDRDSELDILTSHRLGEPVEELESVLTSEQVRKLQQAAREIQVDDSISQYILDIVNGTRDHTELQVGVSPRGAISLYRAAQSLALLSGRDFVVPDDVKNLAVVALAHRVVARGFNQSAQRESVEQILISIIESVDVPV